MVASLKSAGLLMSLWAIQQSTWQGDAGKEMVLCHQSLMSAPTGAKPLCGQRWTLGTASPKAEDSPWWFLHQLRLSYSKLKTQRCWGLDRNNFWGCQRFMCCLETSWLSMLSNTERAFVGNQGHFFQHLFLFIFYLFLFSPWNVLPEALCIKLHPYLLQDREQMISTFLREERWEIFEAGPILISFPPFSFRKGTKIRQVTSSLCMCIAEGQNPPPPTAS